MTRANPVVVVLLSSWAGLMGLGAFFTYEGACDLIRMRRERREREKQRAEERMKFRAAELALGKGPVRELPSSTRRTREHAMEERLHCAEERAEKAAAVAEKLLGDMQLQFAEMDAMKQKLAEMDAVKRQLAEMEGMKQQMARMMSHMGLQPQVSTQQQSDDFILDGGS